MNFTAPWFHNAHEKVWPMWVAPILVPRSPVRILEIGAYEGAATTWLLQRVIGKHPESRIVVVDPWAANGSDYDYEAAHARFVENVQETGLAERVSKLRATSRDALPPMPDASFDMIYIDGDHSAEGAEFDTRQAVRLAKPDGLLVWDDVFFVGEHTADVVAGMNRGLAACGVRNRPVLQIGGAAVMFRSVLP